MDIVSIQAGLASIQSAIEITRLISSSMNVLEKAEFKLKIAEVISALADAKINLADAGDQILSLQQKLKKFEDHASTRSWFTDGVYIILDDNDKAVDGPFCGRCFDVDYMLIRPANDRSGERGVGYCPQCKNKYHLWNAEKRLIDDGIRTEFTG